MSNKHFEYMFTERDKGFFGKVASQVEKTDDSAHYAQLHRDLEADIQLLKTSGPVGDGFAFTKRACAYLGMLADENNTDLDFFPTAFEKVAAAAIHEDVAAMLPGLSKEAKRQLLNDAVELVKKAEEAKLAGGGLAFLKGIGEAGKVMAHGGGEAAVKALKAPVGMAQKAVRGLEDARLGAASRSAKKLQMGADAAKGSAAAAEGSIGKAFHSGRAESLQGSATKALDSRDKKLTSMVGGRAKKLVPDAGGNIAKAPAIKAEAPKTDLPKGEAANETPTTGGASTAESKGGSGIMDSFHKARKHGWHTLGELEKQKLINAGLGAGLAGVAAHDVLSN